MGKARDLSSPLRYTTKIRTRIPISHDELLAVDVHLFHPAYLNLALSDINNNFHLSPVVGFTALNLF
jgi:hypothetical protein